LVERLLIECVGFLLRIDEKETPHCHLSWN
jgi:hypothetical protein